MSRLALLIVTLVASLTLLAAPTTPAVDAAATDPPPAEPVTTGNPFLPEQRDLTDCVGLVERPGCGSESRGGLHQTLVAIVLAGGLLVVFGRIGWVVWRSQQNARSGDSARD